MRDSIRLTVPADASSVPVVRSTITSVGTLLGIGVADMEDVRLATTEVLSYLLRTAPDAHEIEVEIDRREGVLDLRATVHNGIRDLPVEGPDGWLTWHLLDALTDEATLGWSHQGPSIRISKRCAADPLPPHARTT